MEHRRLMDEPVNITMVTYNRVEFTRRSIQSIAETAGYPYLLTVVDNASTDGTVALLRDLHRRGIVHRLILNDKNEGVAFAANQGWDASSDAPYMKVDNDIVFLMPGWLQLLVDASERLPEVGAVGYNFEVQSYPLQVINDISVRPKRGNLGGCAILIPAAVHRRVGFWCEEYFPYGEEDTDMYFRLKRIGLRSYYMADENIGLHLPEGKATPLLDEGRRSVFDEGDAAYRLQKDQWRTALVGRRGLAPINQLLYRLGLRSVRIEHGVRFRPSVLARLFVLVWFRRLDPWNARSRLAPSVITD